MTYTKEILNQKYFLNDKNIAQRLEDYEDIQLNAIPSLELVSALYNSLSTKDNSLSDQVDINRTNDKSELSNTLSSYANSLCISISSQANADVSALSAKLSGEIIDLSIALSTEVSTLSDDVILSVSSIQSQVLSNDNDIEFLSTDLKNADSILNGTLSAVDKNEDDTGDISSLNLIITDPYAVMHNKHDMYYMSFDHDIGTLVLNKMN